MVIREQSLRYSENEALEESPWMMEFVEWYVANFKLDGTQKKRKKLRKTTTQDYEFGAYILNLAAADLVGLKDEFPCFYFSKVILGKVSLNTRVLGATGGFPKLNDELLQRVVLLKKLLKNSTSLCTTCSQLGRKL